MGPSPQRKREWIRFLSFFLLPVLVLTASNLLLLRSDALTYYSIREAVQSEQLDLALVGSSIVFSDFNPQIITEKTGLETYNLTIGHMSLQGALATTRLLLQDKQPKYIALVLESDNFSKTTEDIQTQMRLSPHLVTHPLIAMRYYLDLCSQDHRYMDRLLLFKSSMVRNLDDIRRNLSLWFSPDEFLFESGLLEGVTQYQGRGFMRYMKDGRGYDALRFTPLKHDVADDTPGLEDFSKRKLLEYQALCERYGSQLLVVISPNSTAQVLGRTGFLDKNIALGAFCRENGIPFFDMSLARDSFIPLLDSHYYDMYHLDGTGADIFSEKFGELIRMYIAGEPVDDLFYSSADEFLDSIDFITNTWIEQRSEGGQDVFKADCLRGRTVLPEYAFYLVGEDDSLELLQDYSNRDEYRCTAGSLSGKTLRVYARPAGSQIMLPEIFNDLSIQ